MKTVIETERLFLREMNMDDFEALYAVLGDREIMQHYPYEFDEARVRAWIERNMNRYKENGFGLWAVCLKETGEMIVEGFRECRRALDNGYRPHAIFHCPELYLKDENEPKLVADAELVQSFLKECRTFRF